MSIFDNIKNFISDGEDDEMDDVEELDGEDYPEFDNKQAAPAQSQQTQSARSTGGIGGFSSANPLELKVVKPEKYDSQTAEKIASHLLNKRSVVLNLESTNKESARRLIDFLTGVAYSIGGYIQRVATNTFIIVPKNVDVSGEQLQEVKKTDEDLF